MHSDPVIVKLDTARLALFDAKTIQDTKKILDIAAAAEVYAKRQQLSQESIDYALNIKIEALGQLGRMLKTAPKNAGARGIGKSGVPQENPTLHDLGLDKKTSSLAQKLASLPPEIVEEVKARQLSVTEALRKASHSNRPHIEPPTGTYRVIYADPPWSYGNGGILNEANRFGGAERHYPTMTVEELCALRIKDLAEKDSVLFLWVTSPQIRNCFAVIDAWGFEYRAMFVWDKVKHNFGHYNSVRHELLLICTRGSCTPDSKRLIDSVQVIERSMKHSEKPEAFRAIIDEMYPTGKRIELFARSVHKGWSAWGNEV